MPYGLVWGGAATDKVSVAPAASINDLTTFTALVMEYPTTLSNSRDLISKYRGASNEGWDFSNGPADGTLLYTEVSRATTDSQYRSSSRNRSVNNWYCTVVTVDQGATPVSHHYVGAYNAALGEPTYSTANAGSGAFQTDNARSLFIGNRDVASPATSYQGVLAIVALYNRVLSGAEIEQWRTRPSRSIGSGCVMFIIIGNDGSTGTQVDLSGNGNDGTVSGPTTTGNVQLPLALFGSLVNRAVDQRLLVNGGLVL